MNDALTQGATIGVVGDVHLFWDAKDVAFFNGSNYDMLLFVGDLAGIQPGARPAGGTVAWEAEGSSDVHRRQP